MHKAIQYSLIFVALGVLISAAMGDAFDQTVNQIKRLEAEIEQNQTLIEEQLSTLRENHDLNAPKGEFESNADHAARLRQLNEIIAQRRAELEDEHLSTLLERRVEIQTEISRLHRTVFFTNDITAPLGTYNANTESFPVAFEANNQRFSRNLYVTKNDAPNLKDNWDKVIKTAYLSIDPGYRRSLAEVKLEYPPLWTHGVTWIFDVVYNLGNNNSRTYASCI